MFSFILSLYATTIPPSLFGLFMKYPIYLKDRFIDNLIILEWYTEEDLAFTQASLSSTMYNLLHVWIVLHPIKLGNFSTFFGSNYLSISDDGIAITHHMDQT